MADGGGGRTALVVALLRTKHRVAWCRRQRDDGSCGFTKCTFAHRAQVQDRRAPAEAAACEWEPQHAEAAGATASFFGAVTVAAPSPGAPQLVAPPQPQPPPAAAPVFASAHPASVAAAAAAIGAG
eukprot:gene24092-41027_t